MVWTIWIWITYLLAFNFYIVTFGSFEILYSKLILCFSSLLVLVYTSLKIYENKLSRLHAGFITLCLSALSVNFVLMLVYYVLGYDNYTLNFCSFNGVELFTAIIIFTSGNKHGLFKT